LDSARNDRRTKLLARIETAWTEFRESYADLSDDQLLVPGVTGEWSVRDTIAHVTWWEEEALAHLPSIVAGRRQPRYSESYGGIDAFNALKTEQRREFSLDEVREQAEETHRRLVAYLRSVPEEHLASETRFRRRLRLDTYGHYPLHTREIRSWRARRSLGSGTPTQTALGVL
jgi:hypothetical protein